MRGWRSLDAVVAAPGRDAAADQLTRRALVGARLDRRRLVRRRAFPTSGTPTTGPFFHTDPGPAPWPFRLGRCRSLPRAGWSSSDRSSRSIPPPADTVELGLPACADGSTRPPQGWYGADLHVHLNYSGDHVVIPPTPRACSAGKGCI